MPAPLDALMQDLVSRGTDTLIRHESDWLSPGRSAGQPIHETRLRRRLHMIGVKSGQGRSTALFALAEQIPAGLLSKMFGVHISVTVTWQRTSGGDWMGIRSRRRRPVRHPCGLPDDGRPGCLA